MLKINIAPYLYVCVIVILNNGAGNGVYGDESVVFDTHQAIIDQGYPAEIHHVTTHDGYILEVIRIPHGITKQTRDTVTKPVVFMMHGLLAGASSFVALGPEYSIAYHLVDAGFDVWMGNARGNYYSRFHVTLDPDDPVDRLDFFDFSFEEIGMYDVAAMIDYVLEQTNVDKLHYIGHSQGGTAFLVLSTMRPEYNDKIRGAHLLAAVGYQEHFPNTELAALAERVDFIYGMAVLLGIVEYFPINLNLEEIRSRDLDYCFGDIKYKHMCYLVGTRQIVRDDTESLNLLAGAALKQIAHYGQNIRDKVFRRWHYGTNQNIEVYGTSDPPIYDLNLISTYVTMHYSLSDNLLHESDVLAMAEDINNCKVHRVSRETFLHEEYVSGLDAKELVTDYIIEDILKLEAGDFEDWKKASEIKEDNDTSNNNTEDNEEDTNNTNNYPNSTFKVTCHNNIIVTFLLYLIICTYF